MKNLATQNQNDVTITETGDAFISQRKLAHLCGVEQSNVSRFCASRKIDVNQGISAENAFLCITHYAIESKVANDIARRALVKIGGAGMKAYLYHKAGYQMQAVKPMTQLELMQNAVNELVRIDTEQREHDARLTQIEKRLDFKEAHISVGLWLSRRGYNLTAKEIAPIGKLMTSVTTLRDLPIGREKAGRFDVNTYPEWLLLETLSSKYPDLTK